ncbi:hypothetical protein K490DRAFT_61313 [Saccharata proteae CBS 121410]|uniref:Hydantoinase/oxoprolinase n=1 Tax=Saccharata proteae CBS 121410 TaxID=1314787 RepID=A0A9P4I4X3_9PEZI|nr:hypothetical protein K490DRAFT_61313 [Saccharata proteae CBS 121410]
MASVITKNIRIGVDVGGTNTDAVALDTSAQHEKNRGVVANFKTPTTPEVTSGIETAVGAVLEKAGVSLDQIACVTIGTTHFINAVIEQDARRLKKVGVIRLSKSFLRQIPPFSEFPAGLTRLIKSYVGYVDGGLHIDGSQEAPIVEEQVIRECKALKEHGLTSVVVAGIFSPIDEVFQQEKRVREIILRELPGIDVVCSHEVANIGFLERENAAILNASILKYGRRTMRGFKEAMNRLHLKCGLYITQNDGTLIDAASAARMPIRTFSSGATNSMRGAAYLAGGSLSGSSAVVIDIGGTTSDAGVLLQSGFPRQASAYVAVAGVKVNYSMPLLHSIGLGGGSIVRESDGKVTVGPDSVGHFITTEAKVFGGDKLTATDISVAANRADVGKPALVESVDAGVVAKAQDRIKSMLEGIVDLCKTSPEDIPVLLVGGGSIVAPESLKGASKIICPPFHDVANAVGAAVSKVGGVIDIVQSTEHQTQQEAIQRAKDLAIKRATEAGAIPSTIGITEIDSLPVSYVANKLRTVVKAVGELDVALQPASLEEKDDTEDEVEEAKEYGETVMEDPITDPFTYKPNVGMNAQTGYPEWLLSETDVNWLAEGCYVLGCAGGGSPAATRIQLRDQLREGHVLKIVDASALDEKACIYWGGHMGSPAVSVERLNALETIDAFKALMEYLRHDSFDAVIGLEIGGANGLEPLLVGSSKYFDRPTVDADFMGRAYPTYWQTTLAVHKPGSLVPCAIDSGDGKTIIMTRASNDEIVDRALRASCAEMGSRVGKAGAPTTTEMVRKFSVINTYSLAWRIGRCIARAEASNTLSRVCEGIVEEVGGEETARILFRGKIVAVERRLFKGHSYGEITIGGIPAEEEDEGAKDAMPALASGGVLKIPFKNENLYAEHTNEDGSKRIVCTVPDLIAVLDTGSGRALGVPEFRYGLRVTVLGITCSPQWTSTDMGLAIGGPKAFGYDLEYSPLGKYVKPRSVIEEYAPQM